MDGFQGERAGLVRIRSVSRFQVEPRKNPAQAKLGRGTLGSKMNAIAWATGPAFASNKSDNYFLAGGAIASFVAFATRNFTTVLALI
jgi:hypothetical protein